MSKLWVNTEQLFSLSIILPMIIHNKSFSRLEKKTEFHLEILLILFLQSTTQKLFDFDHKG